MTRHPRLLFLFALLGFALAGLSLLWTALFVRGGLVPQQLSGPLQAPWAASLLIDLGLVLLFGAQHSVMPRAWFKRWFARRFPADAERVCYVWASSAALIALVLLWQPLPGMAWSLRGTAWGGFLIGAGLLGLVLTVLSSVLIDSLDLLGLRLPLLRLRGREFVSPPFQTPLFYKHVRHPIQLGVLLLMWGTASMSVARLVLVAAFSVYVLVGIVFEERDLLVQYGDDYRRYQQRTPMLLPRLHR